MAFVHRDDDQVLFEVCVSAGDFGHKISFSGEESLGGRVDQLEVSILHFLP
jgi:hypothetical protein